MLLSEHHFWHKLFMHKMIKKCNHTFFKKVVDISINVWHIHWYRNVPIKEKKLMNLRTKNTLISNCYFRSVGIPLHSRHYYASPWNKDFFLCLKHWFSRCTQGLYTTVVHKAIKTDWFLSLFWNTFLLCFYRAKNDLFLESCPFDLKKEFMSSYVMKGLA